jgi:integrative and conjugative element protein (TIGR02256 family)
VSVFLAPDRSIAVEIEPQAMTSMLKVCSRAGGLETGGVLIGRYSPFGDRVVVSRVTGPPRDSQRFRFNFIRGIAGLTRRFEQAWRDGLYYIGEWHLHPKGSPQPTDTDAEQVLEFSRQRDYRCQHPVLVVVGGDPSSEWLIAVELVMSGRLLALQRAPHG